MKKFVALITKEKPKVAMNEWKNDSDILRALNNVYKQVRTILFPCLVVNLFK